MENFNSIYDQYHSMVYNFINSKIRNTEVSEELANDVFVKIHQHLDTYNEKLSAFRTWVMNIAKNTLIDYWRKRKLETISIEATVTIDWDGTVELTRDVTDNSTVENTFITNESIEAFKQELKKLSKPYKKIAHLYYNKQFTYEEIADKLDIPIGSVKGNIFRIKNTLLEKLNNVL